MTAAAVVDATDATHSDDPLKRAMATPVMLPDITASLHLGTDDAADSHKVEHPPGGLRRL
jgi:hypothetical protein